MRQSLALVTLASWMAKMRRNGVQGQPGQRVYGIPSQSIVRHDNADLSPKR
jgi:hypothetical protein